MKRFGLMFTLVAFSATAMAQGAKVTSATSNIKYGQLDKAKEAIEEAILHEKTKGQAKTWMVRGDVYKAIAESKNPDMKALCATPTRVALDSYKKAIALDAKGNLRKQINAQLSLMSFTVYNAAIEFNDKKDLVNALDCFEQSLAIDTLTAPGKVDSAIVYNAGLVADQGKNYEKARFYYNRCLDIHYGGAQIYGLLAIIDRTQGDTAAYLAMLDKGMKAYPNDCNMLQVELINHYIGHNQSDKALEYLAKAIASEPNNVSYYFAQGALLDKIGKPDEAKASYDKALEINPDHFDSWLNLGVQVYNKAVEMAKAANDIPANKPKEYDAAIAAAFEQMNKAVPYFEKCHSINPKDVYTMQVLKECYYKLRSSHPEYNDKYNDMKAQLDAAEQK
ncbi:MAG: tetratricopeptide repeat protein [Salinivirgaceae bacterium]|nr:tetratricopeptide repeat protein [Salinivirgaceae bacterium]